MRMFRTAILIALFAVSVFAQGGMMPGPGTPHAVGCSGSTFPCNPTPLDNFNRSNGAIGSNWSTAAGVFGGTTTTACTIASNTADCSWPKGSYWNVVTFGDDQESFGTCTAISDCVIFVRLQQIGASTVDGYSLERTNASTVLMRKIANGTASTLKTVTVSTSNGDSLGIRHDGSTLYLWVKIGAGAWAQQDSVADSSYTGTGSIGLGSSTIIDNFGGGSR